MKLTEILPQDHPYLKDKVIVEEANSVADLLNTIENWKRGLESWDNVEHDIKKVKEAIHESTQ